jgi:hypothetical protein
MSRDKDCDGCGAIGSMCVLELGETPDNGRVMLTIDGGYWVCESCLRSDRHVKTVGRAKLFLTKQG